MALTFKTLCSWADWTDRSEKNPKKQKKEEKIDHAEEQKREQSFGNKLDFASLHYNIQIILPETKDIAVYDAIFSSLRKHLS